MEWKTKKEAPCSKQQSRSTTHFGSVTPEIINEISENKKNNEKGDHVSLATLKFHMIASLMIGQLHRLGLDRNQGTLRLGSGVGNVIYGALLACFNVVAGSRYYQTCMISHEVRELGLRGEKPLPLRKRDGCEVGPKVAVSIGHMEMLYLQTQHVLIMLLWGI